MARIRITDIREVPTLTPEGQLKEEMLITYLVDGVRAYQTRLPKEGFSPEQAMEQIKAEEKERQKVIGLEFEV